MLDTTPVPGKTYELTVRVSVVAPDDEDGAHATWDELVTAAEAAMADGEFDVDAVEHTDGVELWTMDGANVVEIDGARNW